MKSVAALVAAVLLVVAAVVARNRMAGDDDGGGGHPTVACPTELAKACATLADGYTVRVEDAGVTADRLATAKAADDARVDLWLAPAPWAELVSDRRSRASLDPLVGRPSDVIARSPVAVATWDDRAAALDKGICKGTLNWKCLGDAAERPWGEVGGNPAWGTVHVGLTDPHTATGLIVLGGATAGFLGTSDYAANDFGGDLAGWLGALGAHSQEAAAGEPVARMLTRGPAEFAAVGATESTARQAAVHDGTHAAYPAPMATADLVAIPVGAGGGSGDRAARLARDGDLRRALAAGGWRVAGQRSASGVDTGTPLPAGDGLPSGAVLGALLDEWDQVTG